jgi:hypothetical protein
MLVERIDAVAATETTSTSVKKIDAGTATKR